MGGLIPLYRGKRYHLKEYSRNPPKTMRELFNLRHSSLRNAIERAFGVLKKRFPIMANADEPKFDVRRHTRIILACCILHNFLMGVDPDEDILREVDEELANRTDVEHENQADDVNEEDDVARGQVVRDRIGNGCGGITPLRCL
ncbi:unnamed protein product [Cuscuta epithymum]|uniref:DDE Tnp4 domain-containing protein n=1 Tax=Cuscuta epithymum TaxID=186058 RepID=A0AAV0D147_9ASTE|nr:unnamed protein product [Cuscuta epithymum]CAH9132477.1 unnamed protein product [Cuscuta epithymum]